ncbi:MAG: AAA family ATPase [Microgenomates group bacterium]
MNPTQSKFTNITISGLPGCGSTTLLQKLKAEDSLKFDGWKGFSGGEFMRAYAIEHGHFDKNATHHHAATDYGDDFDREVDMGMRDKLTNENHWILESWLSGFMAQRVPNVLKVLMICSDDAVRIDRIVNRDGVAAEVAKNSMYDRYISNLEKWQRMYSNEWRDWVVDSGTRSANDPIDFWHQDLYDVVIDTYSINQQKALETVLNAINKD